MQINVISLMALQQRTSLSAIEREQALRDLAIRVNAVPRHNSVRPWYRTNPGSPTRKRHTLWLDHSARCHWCYRVTTIEAPENGKLTGDIATIEHLHSRFSPHRAKRHGTSAVVLACHRCNLDRSVMENKIKVGKWVHPSKLARFLCGLDGDGI